jgi:hypothetical protein
MGIPLSPEPVQLVCGVIYAPDAFLTKAIRELVDRFGSVDYESDVLEFDKTDFYAREMGVVLLKKFYAFEKLIEPEDIVDVKLSTNRIEDLFIASDGQHRTINLDPGYVGLSKFVLATTKDSGHRIYIRDGIYAESTLRYVRGTFEPFEWTYPDYRTREYIDFLNKVRTVYHKRLTELVRKKNSK